MTDEKKLQELKVQFLGMQTAEAVANLFDITYKQLSSIIYGMSDHKKYKEFPIKKKSGAVRLVSAPCKRLKEIQEILSKILYEIYQQKTSAHGFCIERSVVTNARQHLDKRFIFNIDLKDFFGSIHFGRVKNLFKKEPFYLPHSTATVLAQICCHNNKLPQGAPTSPIISNMIARKLDGNLAGLAKKYKCTYTRYADDISFSFSCSQKKLPDAILYESEGSVYVGHKLEEKIQENGFLINESKVRLCLPGQRKEVTGITVNEFPNVKRSFIRRIGSMVRAWEIYGLDAAQNHYEEHYKHTHPQRASESIPQFQNVLNGKINYLKMVRGEEDPIYRKLAYRYSVCMGKPRTELLRKPHEKIYNSLFIIENQIDDTQGTGFLLEGHGLVTNNHVVASLPDNEPLDETGGLSVFQFHNPDKKYTARVVGRSGKNDLAVLTFEDQEALQNTPFLKRGNSSAISTGNKVTLLGFPQYAPGSNPHVAPCYVTSKREYLHLDIYTINTSVVHGNSGGPVLDEQEKVVGIATVGSETFEVGDKSTLHGFIPINLLGQIKTV